MSRLNHRPALRIAATLIALMIGANLQAETYELGKAIAVAQEQDIWLQTSQQRQASLVAQGVAAGTLPDPRVGVSLANLPADSFDFDQEGMTQFKMSVSQMFPRGKTRSLQSARFKELSGIEPLARVHRKAMVASEVAQLWWEGVLLEQTIALIEGDRGLFEHLVDVAQSNYTVASGRVRQQDLVRAQLELTRLDDRVTRLQQQKETILAQLSEWLNDFEIHLDNRDGNSLLLSHDIREIMASNVKGERQKRLSEVLTQHPKIRQIDEKLKAMETGVKLAEQSYKPQWGVNAAYGYRDDTPMGISRADLVSVGITFDVPLFTADRQDQKVRSAVANKEMIKTERVLALRQLKAKYEVAEAQHHRLLERQRLYSSRLLKEMAEQAEASLSAYTHDDGDFAEVVRAKIAELNARIEALQIHASIQKNIARLNYFSASNSEPYGDDAITTLSGETHAK